MSTIKVETGHFEGFPGVTCAMSPEGGGEYTICGDAFDVDSEGEGHGRWVQTGKPVTCRECKRVIQGMREVRLSSVTRSRRGGML